MGGGSRARLILQEGEIRVGGRSRPDAVPAPQVPEAYSPINANWQCLTDDMRCLNVPGSRDLPLPATTRKGSPVASLLERIGGAAVRRRRATVLSWLLIAAAIIGLAQVAGGPLIDNMSIPGSETQRASDLLRARFPAFAGGSAEIVFQAREGRIADEANAAAIAATLDRVRVLPDVIGISSPLAPEGRAQVSPDGTIAYADIRYGVPVADVGPTDMAALEAAMDGGRSPALQVEGGGEAFLANTAVGGSFAELIGVGMAILVLVVAFGSLVAAGLPIVTALFGIVVGLSVVTLMARFVDISLEGPTIAMMLGLGAGIDYALFVVTRHRELLRRGMSVEQAAGRANATSGLAVVFAGSTVVVALLGLSFTGIAAIGSLGLAAAAVVAVTVLAAVTLLPALLGFAGQRIDRLAFRLPGSASHPARDVDIEHGASNRWARRVVNRPWPHLLVGGAVLLLLASPVLTLRLGQPDAGNLSTSDTQRRAYDLLARGFGPGFNGPLAIVLSLPAGGGPADPANAGFIAGISSAIAADPTVVAVGPAIPSVSGDTAVITAIPRTAPQDPGTDRLIRRLRTGTLPPIVSGAGPRAVALVAGPTAAVIDLARALEASLPLFIGAVVLLSGLLLSLVFRSVVVPLTAALLNLVSIGAAYGAVVAIFQWGWGVRLLGLESTVPIVSVVPILMFAVLFGLSMDYHVFLVSRVREEYLRTGDPRQSVVVGLTRTARVISSAAFVMVCVFLAFATSDAPLVKMMAVGSAVAVLVDATLVRMILVPAAMALFGRANWWLPGPLDRVMPQFVLDGRPEAAEG